MLGVDMVRATAVRGENTPLTGLWFVVVCCFLLCQRLYLGSGRVYVCVCVL